MNYRIDDRWFLEGYGDIGGLGGGSNFTSEGILEVGYNWTKTVSTELGFGRSTPTTSKATTMAEASATTRRCIDGWSL